MWKHYFKTAWRNLVKYKSFSVINLIGLTFGLASVIALAFMLYQAVTANGLFQSKERMYYLRSKTSEGNMYRQTTYPLLDEIIKSCSQVEAGTHIQQWYSPWLKYSDKEFQQNTYFVDTAFFKVFSYPLKYGNANTSLINKYSVVLSEDVAEKFFGKANPIGKTIVADDTISLTVTGVMRSVPTNTTMRPEILLTTNLLKDNHDFASAADWYNDFAENYLLLKPNADTALLNKQINALIQRFYVQDAKSRKVMLSPFNDFIKNEAGNLTNVMIKGQIGMIVFILLILVINLTNLNTATMYNRAKEVAVKKMIGSKRIQIVLQFCIENALIIFPSLALAFLLFYFLLIPQMNTIIKSSFGELALNMRHDYPLISWFVVGGLIVAIAAASYPAFHLNSLKITDVVKGKISKANKKQYGRNIFITIQFVLAITCIGITLVLNKQIHFMKQAVLGFDKDNVLVAPLDLSYRNKSAAPAQFDALLNTLRNNPYVKGVSTSNDIPASYSNNSDTYLDPVSNKKASIQYFSVDVGLIPTYKIQMLEGKNFDNVPKANMANKIIINEAAMKTFNWQSAVGKQIKGGSGNAVASTIIGVVKDFHYANLMQNVGPLLLYYNDKQNLNAQYLSVRVEPGHTKEIGNLLQKKFAKIPSRRPFSYEFLDSRIDDQYSLLNGILKVTNFVSVLLIVIASLGLFGLVTLFAKQRTKEIGIRKIFGASTKDIVKMLSQNYLLLIGIASVIALSIVYIVMSKWLQDFATRITISWVLLISAALIAVVVAMSIVIYQSFKAAKANPVKSLKTE
ncbi:MAG: ABC transporter permease [Arachidicoccus sp.]|nr:ABC transporter permease [Arachidicoccus sp.]